MNQFTRTMTAITLGLTTTLAIAAPKQLVTHNTTDVESNAYIAGTIPSQHPTKAHSDNHVNWAAVKMACFGHVTNGKCWAVVKMATNTPNPVEIGIVSIDVDTGIITPQQISNNGYTFTVNGPGETTVSMTNP
jgi:hypothetical protein